MCDYTKFLLVEPSVLWQAQIRTQLLGKPVTFIPARTLRMAQDRLSQNPDIRVVAVADSIAGGELDTLEWVRQVRQMEAKFPKIIMIGFTSNCNFGDKLVEAGCNFYSFRSQTADKVLEILKIPVEAGV